MSKSFRKQSPIAMRKALRTIQKIAMINNEDEKNEPLNDIYMIAHSFIGDCDNHHEDWKEFTDEMEENLKDY